MEKIPTVNQVHFSSATAVQIPYPRSRFLFLDIWSARHGLTDLWCYHSYQLIRILFKPQFFRITRLQKVLCLLQVPPPSLSFFFLMTSARTSTLSLWYYIFYTTMIDFFFILNLPSEVRPSHIHSSSAILISIFHYDRFTMHSIPTRSSLYRTPLTLISVMWVFWLVLLADTNCWLYSRIPLAGTLLAKKN